MLKNIWIQKMASHKEAEAFDARYYFNMSRIERLETLQFLREIYDKMRKDRRNACSKGLRRSIKVIK